MRFALENGYCYEQITLFVEVIMEKPFQTRTSRRLTSFSAAAFAYLSLKVFDVRISSLSALGLETSVPEEFIPVTLFVATTYFFFRYMLDMLSDVWGFNWHTYYVEENRNLCRIIEQNKKLVCLLKNPTSNNSVIWFGELAGQRDVANSICERLARKVAEVKNARPPDSVEARLERQRIVLEDGRLNALEASKSTVWSARRRLISVRIGFPVLFGYFLFDFLAPVTMFVLVIIAANEAPKWMLYENLSRQLGIAENGYCQIPEGLYAATNPECNMAETLRAY